MSPLLGAGDFLSWSLTVPRDLLAESAGREVTGTAAAHRIAGAGDLDRMKRAPWPDRYVFGEGGET